MTQTAIPSQKPDSTGTTQYAWDFDNRLTEAIVPGVGTTTFRYDPFGRRIQKSGPLGTTNFLYDGQNLLEELDQSGNVLARYTHSEHDRDELEDEPLAQLRSGTTSYYEQDGIDSVTSLTNPAGALANSYTSFFHPKVPRAMHCRKSTDRPYTISLGSCLRVCGLVRRALGRPFNRQIRAF